MFYSFVFGRKRAFALSFRFWPKKEIDFSVPLFSGWKQKIQFQSASSCNNPCTSWLQLRLIELARLVPSSCCILCWYLFCCGLLVSVFVRVFCCVHDINCLAAARAQQPSGSGDKVPPPRPPPPRTQQPAQGWFLVVTEPLPCLLSFTVVLLNVKFGDCTLWSLIRWQLIFCNNFYKSWPISITLSPN